MATLSLVHIRLSHSTRSDIDRKLYQGVTVERILDDVRNCVISQRNCSHLQLTKKDIYIYLILKDLQYNRKKLLCIQLELS